MYVNDGSQATNRISEEDTEEFFTIENFIGDMKLQDISTLLKYLELDKERLGCVDAVGNRKGGRPFMQPGCNFPDDIEWVMDQLCHMDKKNIPRMIAFVKNVQHDLLTKVGLGKRCDLCGKIVL
jgi:hypothetical protein